MSYESSCKDGGVFYSTQYISYKYSNGSVVTKVSVFETDILTMVLKQMNMTFVQVPTPEGFEIEEGLRDNLIRAMIV